MNYDHFEKCGKCHVYPCACPTQYPGADSICPRCGSLYCPTPGTCSYGLVSQAALQVEVVALRERIEKLEAPRAILNRGYVPLEEYRAVEKERDAWKTKHDALDKHWDERMSAYKREADAKAAEALRSRDEARAHVDKMQSKLTKLGQAGQW